MLSLDGVTQRILIVVLAISGLKETIQSYHMILKY